jgi:predicted regulator of Ras-like GTPase activity (Roadblock/LC7/MglB family)
MENDNHDTPQEEKQYKPMHGKKVSDKQAKVRKPRSRKESSTSEENLTFSSTISEISEEKKREPTREDHSIEPSTKETDAISHSEETSASSTADYIDTQTTPVDTVEQSDSIEDDSSVADYQDSSSTSKDFSDNEVSEETEIPPIRQIRNLLADFEMRVPVWGLTVFTVDGYILAHRLFYDGMPENIELAVSSMSAGLITISQDFLQLVSSESLFQQVLIDADNSNGPASFSIMLKHIADNVMLTCIFPNNAKLGLVSFEIENLSNAINEIVGLWDVKLHEETVT